MFYSLQGEGPSVGVPSVFIRLQGCNLSCGRGMSGDSSWVCDTIEVWPHGKPYSVQQLIDYWAKMGWIKALKQGARLIVTGGEPLLQIDGVFELLSGVMVQLNQNIQVEIETNGTIPCPDSFNLFQIQYNVSPKLMNSGMALHRRIVPEAIQSFLSRESIFKFVVNSEDDVLEVMNTIVDPFNIPKKRVYLMPGVETRVGLRVMLGKVSEWCKKYYVNLGHRLHIELWDQATGV